VNTLPPKYRRCHGCSRVFMPNRPNQLACSHACRQRAWLRRHSGPPKQAPLECDSCGESLVDTEHPTRHHGEAWCLAELGFFEHWIDVRRGVGQLEEALRLFRALREGWGTSHALRRLGWFRMILGDYARATELLQEAVTLARQAGNQHALAWSLVLVGNVAWLHRKDAATAGPMFEESLTLVSQTHDVHNFQYAMLGLGQLAQARGDYDAARSRYEQVVAYISERGIDFRAADLSTVVLAFAQLAVATGNQNQAARLFGSAHMALA
jgi:tetratricopeptide (TPR) repeat protein